MKLFSLTARRGLAALVLFSAAPLASVTAQEDLAPGRIVPWRKADVAPTGSYSLTLEYGGVFLRDLEETSLRGTELDDLGVFDGEIDPLTETRNVELASNAIYVRGAYSLYAPEESPYGVEIFLMLGTSNVELDGDVRDPGEFDNSFNVNGDFGILVGGGVRGRIYSMDRLKFLADFTFQWTQHDTDISKVPNLDLDLDPGDSARQDFETDVLTWQLSLYASYLTEVGDLAIAPYGGIRFSGVSLEIDGKQTFFDPAFDGTQGIHYEAEQDNILGIFFGAEASFTENVSAFLEVSLIDQYSLTLGAGYRF